jgi:hypothetical protein
MRIFFILFCTALSLFPAAARAYSPPELEGLLAPVALYPDPVVQDVLSVSAATDQASSDAAWANLAAYPELMERMKQSPQWLADLGNAWRFQPGDVMAAVQALRMRASAAETIVPSVPAFVPYPYYRPRVFVTRIVVGRPAFQPHARVHSQPYRRIPESRRAPIVQSRVAPSVAARPPAFHHSGSHHHPGGRRH